LSTNAKFKRVDISKLLPDNLSQESTSYGQIQLFPHIDGIDGFFISKMIREF